jgi:hypothetical protein
MQVYALSSLSKFLLSINSMKNYINNNYFKYMQFSLDVWCTHHHLPHQFTLFFVSINTKNI